MKNITIEKSRMVCVNDKYEIRFSRMGEVAAKCGWTSFPTSETWVKNGGIESDRIALLSACNAAHKALTETVVHSAAYAAMRADTTADRVKTYDAERAAIMALRNIVNAIGTRYDRHGRRKATACIIDETAVKSLYTLTAGKSVLELCAPATFAKKVVPFLIFMMKGYAVNVAADKAHDENATKSDKADKPRETLKSVREECDQLRNELEVAKAVEFKATNALDKVRAYVIANETLDRNVLVEMLGIKCL